MEQALGGGMLPANYFKGEEFYSIWRQTNKGKDMITITNDKLSSTAAIGT